MSEFKEGFIYWATGVSPKQQLDDYYFDESQAQKRVLMWQDQGDQYLAKVIKVPAVVGQKGFFLLSAMQSAKRTKIVYRVTESYLTDWGSGEGSGEIGTYNTREEAERVKPTSSGFSSGRIEEIEVTL